MKTLAMLTNGGDTCALNASMKSIRDSAYRVGYKKIYGVRRGYQGLLDGSIEDITHKEIDVRKGGSFLGSMRESPAKLDPTSVDKDVRVYVPDDGKCQTMARCLADYEIDVLVVIGGDGTLQSTQLFQQWILERRTALRLRAFELLGFLKTIDNDVRTKTFFQGIEVALCPGFPSAVQKIVGAVEGLRVTARTGERAFAVECMGRDAGWLAASGTFGGAEILIVPEILESYLQERSVKDRFSNEGPAYRKHLKETRREKNKNVTDRDIQLVLAAEIIWAHLAETTASYYQKNRNVIIAVAEGFETPTENDAVRQFVEIIHDLYGPRKKVGATELLALTLSPVLQYYFSCLSQLVQGVVATSLEDAIERVMKTETPERSNYQKLVVSQGWKHPLNRLNIRKMLREAVSLGARVPPYRFELRPHRTDYQPRSGQPSPYDYKLASVLGQKIGEMLENREFGFVPAMAEVVKFDELSLKRVKTESIGEIRTLDFASPDYFKPRSNRLKVSDRITDFFRTITSGPDTLEEAIDKTDNAG
jgi:6-phosphofructokinase